MRSTTLRRLVRQTWLLGPALVLAAFLAACGSGGGETPPAAEGTPIGPAGGTVAGPGGITLSVPAGALATEQRLQVKPSTRGLPSSPSMPGIGPAIDLLPHGTRFAVPVTLSIPLDAALQARRFVPWFAKWSGDGKVLDLIADGRVENGRFVVEISSFSSGQMAPPAGPIPFPPWIPGPNRICPPDPPSTMPMCPLFIVQPPPLVTLTVGDTDVCVGCLTAIGSVAPFEWPVDMSRPTATLAIFGLQWTKDGVDLPGQTGPFLILPAVNVFDNGVYALRIVNELAWTTTSHPFTVNVVPPAPPSITMQPASIAVASGASASFTVTATGAGTLAFEWRRDGHATGETGSTQSVGPVSAADDGARFDVVVKNAAGSVTSMTATLQVLPPLDLPLEVHTLAVGILGGAAIGAGGGLRTWGDDRMGGLGDAPVHPITAFEWGPYDAAALADVKSVVASVAGAHLLAIVGADEEVWGWGASAFGQVGAPLGGTSHPMPARIGTLTQVRRIAAGGDHSLALRADGTLWAWGRNDRGQLGEGSGMNQAAPQQVPGLPPVVAIAAGGSHSLAVAADNSVWAWGSNAECQLGDAVSPGDALPRPVAGLAGQAVVAVAAGGSFSLALTIDGRVWSWGGNNEGEQGTGQVGAPQCTPTALPIPDVVAAIAAGWAHGAAVGSAGTLWTWGNNLAGQVGASADTWLAVRSIDYGVDDFAAGGLATLWRREGRTFGRGDGMSGELGLEGLGMTALDANRDLNLP